MQNELRILGPFNRGIPLPQQTSTRSGIDYLPYIVDYLPYIVIGGIVLLVIYGSKKKK